MCTLATCERSDGAVTNSAAQPSHSHINSAGVSTYKVRALTLHQMQMENYEKGRTKHMRQPYQALENGLRTLPIRPTAPTALALIAGLVVGCCRSIFEFSILSASLLVWFLRMFSADTLLVVIFSTLNNQPFVSCRYSSHTEILTKDLHRDSHQPLERHSLRMHYC